MSAPLLLVPRRTYRILTADNRVIDRAVWTGTVFRKPTRTGGEVFTRAEVERVADLPSRFRGSYWCGRLKSRPHVFVPIAACVDAPAPREQLRALPDVPWVHPIRARALTGGR